jgi:cytochrome P450
VIDWVHRSRPQSFRRFQRIEPIFREFGIHGVFSAEGSEWPSQRRLAVSALAQRNLKAFFGTIRRVTERLFGRWERAAEEGTTIDLLEDLMLFTVDVTSTLAFGRVSNTIENPEDRIQQHLRLIFPNLERRLTALFPYWRVVRLPKDRELDRALAALDAWIEEVVKETRQRLQEHPELEERPENFLEAMLVMRGEDGKAFDPTVIKGNMFTMLLAGEDTTAGAVAWTVHEAIERPDVVGRLVDEADSVLGHDKIAISVEQTQGLRYTLAALNEALRIRPVVPNQTFTTTEDVNVQGVHLPKGTHVSLLMRRASTIPEAGGKEFSPARFLEEESMEVLKRRGVHLPFGSGPRVCPGRSLALLEGRVILSLLFKNFRIERVGSYQDVKERQTFTMAPHGLKVRLHNRHS